MATVHGKPIACTLGPKAMAPRLARIRSMTRRHLRAYRLEGNRVILTYDLAASDELHRIVGLERDCCAFLEFDIRTQADAIELHIVGPDQEGGDTQWLFSQFLPGAPSATQSARACCKGYASAHEPIS